ncbi:MAG: phosphoribosylglycinamide formyltransferase [Vicingaceae bacterium]
MSKIAIFASGAGSNAAKIIEYFEVKTTMVSVDCIVTNQQEAGVYEVATKHNVPIFYLSNAAIEVGNEVLTLLKERKIEWIVLAGFLRKIPAIIIQSYPDRIINLHPSLLPKFGGKGMYGKKVHQQVIESGETESGISIHLVNEEYDKGEIILQQKCMVDTNETVESLSKKVQMLEHKFFPIAIEQAVEFPTSRSY